MKNKRGFTLVELLAIIVILAVIMVIAVPKILDVVNGSKSSAWKDNVGMIKKAIVTNSQLVDVETGTYKYSIDKLCSDPSKVNEVVKLEDTTVTCSGNTFTLTGKGQFAGKSATITCNNKNCSVSISDSNQVELAAGLYDSNDNLIASWDELVNTYGMDINWIGEDIPSSAYGYFSTSFVTFVPESDITEPGWYKIGANLESVSIDQIDSNQPAVVIGKILGNKSGAKIVIPATITEIPMFAFTGISVSSIEIPSTTTTIGVGAFAYATNLTSLTIPNGVTAIGVHAFVDCTSLPSVTIPGSVTTFEEAFLETGLSSVVISDGVTEISNHAFEGCKHLTSITIPNSVTTIGEDAFRKTGLSTLTIPGSVKTIGDYAFEKCSNLGSVILSEGVETVGNNAFHGCENLTSITLPNSLVRIMNSAFENCYRLTSITIPENVIYIGNNAFYVCTSLSSVTFKNINGWRLSPYETFNADDWSNPSTAATYLKDTYAGYNLAKD